MVEDKKEAAKKEKKKIKTKEYELLAKVLRLHRFIITYGENKVIFTSRNQKESKSVHVPNELIPTIRQLFDPTVPENIVELDKIGGYLLEILKTISEMNYAVSTPKERELKKAMAQYLREDIEQKHKELLEDMIQRFLKEKKE